MSQTIDAILNYLTDKTKVAKAECSVVTDQSDSCTPAIRARFLPPETSGREKIDIRALFCTPFFIGSGTKTHTEWGTVVHEMVHVVKGSIDWKYDDEDVLDMAILKPEIAVLNPDSYRYFIEAFVNPGRGPTPAGTSP